MLKFKIILAGAKDVGKSSLIARYCDNVFSESMHDTIGVAFKRKKIQINENQDIEINIWDFGGDLKYRLLFPSYVNGASAAFILYDTTNRESLDDIKNWVQLIRENINYDNTVKILIGTKIDLEDQRVIHKPEAIEISKQYGCSIEPIETSAKTGENVEEAFISLTQEIIKMRLRECKSCSEYFTKKLKFCPKCGEIV